MAVDAEKLWWYTAAWMGIFTDVQPFQDNRFSWGAFGAAGTAAPPCPQRAIQITGLREPTQRSYEAA